MREPAFILANMSYLQVKDHSDVDVNYSSFYFGNNETRSIVVNSFLRFSTSGLPNQLVDRSQLRVKVIKGKTRTPSEMRKQQHWEQKPPNPHTLHNPHFAGWGKKRVKAS
jgi:hypothetical protein